jgi:hypothetical protein
MGACCLLPERKVRVGTARSFITSAHPDSKRVDCQSSERDAQDDSLAVHVAATALQQYRHRSTLRQMECGGLRHTILSRILVTICIASRLEIDSADSSPSFSLVIVLNTFDHLRLHTRCKSIHLGCRIDHNVWPPCARLRIHARYRARCRQQAGR